MILSACAPGAEVRVRAVSAESALALRLRELGVRPGTRLRVAGRGAAGACIVAIGAARLSLAAAAAAAIEVDAA